MYFQKDYVLRMIEMTGELIRRICSIARDADAREELSEVCQRACGLPLSMLRTGDPKSLCDLLDEPQRFLAAELLLIDVEIDKRTQTEDQLLPTRVQALRLLASLREPDYLPPACDKASALLSLTQDALPGDLLLSLADLCERGGQFGAAEDAYFAALEVSPDAWYRLEHFYHRLSSLDDRQLQAGGFTRAEIEEGRAALAQRRG